MGKFVVIVLDGFGVGAMPDVPQVRPADCGANTCVHIFERTPDLKLPNLASLGLANIVGREFPGLPFATDATFGRADARWCGHLLRPSGDHGHPPGKALRRADLQ